MAIGYGADWGEWKGALEGRGLGRTVGPQIGGVGRAPSYWL